MEDLGPEPRNVGQENFVGRKIFRRLTSPLAATLPIKSYEEAAVGSELARARGSARQRAAYKSHLAVL